MPDFRLGFAAAVLLISALAALAQDGAPTLDCGKATAQPDLNDCAYRDYEAADADLNAEYRKALVKARVLDGEYGGQPVAVDALKSAQRAWIGYRDGQCVLAGLQARGGQAEAMLVSGCLAELTRSRTQELREFVEREG